LAVVAARFGLVPPTLFVAFLFLPTAFGDARGQLPLLIQKVAHLVEADRFWSPLGVVRLRISPATRIGGARL
jgi:hypothetical protein